MSPSFDNDLRCNWLQCRKELLDQALVTTCSHVYCVECATRERILGLPPSERAPCPACHQSLRSIDDVVVRSLDVTDEYKTMILSGLRPSIIMECAGRAMSLWEYQSAQEINYHKYLIKSSRKRYQSERRRLETIITDTQEKSRDLEAQIADLESEKNELIRKNESLEIARAELKKRLSSQQEHYQSVKRAAAMNNMEQTVAKSQTPIAQQFSPRIPDYQHPHGIQDSRLEMNANAANTTHLHRSGPAGRIASGFPPYVVDNRGSVWCALDSNVSGSNQMHASSPSQISTHAFNPLSHNNNRPPVVHQQSGDLGTTTLSTPSPTQSIHSRSRGLSVNAHQGNGHGNFPSQGMGLSSGMKRGYSSTSRFQ